MSTLSPLLLATQDPQNRAQAEAKLKEAEAQNFAEYFAALATELATEGAPVISRQLAGLLLKNGLASKDPKRNLELQQRWSSLDEGKRNFVKEATTSALVAQDHNVGKAAAQVVGKIGCIELPHSQWPGLVPLLLQHVTNPDVRCRRVSLIALGFLCEDLVPLHEDGVTMEDGVTNNILTAVVQGMRDTDNVIKYEATRAFYHALVLAQRSFSMDNERNFIMTVVVETCKAPDEAVQAEAFSCLVQIASWYYKCLPAYMPSLGPLSLDAIKNCAAGEKVAMASLEFWSTICDEELEVSENIALNVPGENVSHHIIQQVIPHLVPLLLEVLVRGQTGEDDDSWNLSQASGVCLGLVANLVGDLCVDIVLGFISQHFANPDWKYREAAVLAYGSILEGPTSAKMAPVVQSSFASLANSMEDKNVAVRDTVAWTLGRIAQFHPSIVPIKDLTPLLVRALSDVPRVAEKVCWVILEMAEKCAADSLLPGQAPNTTPLSEFFTGLAEKLLEVSKRPDANERNLRTAAYNSLSTLIENSGNDCIPFLGKLVEEMLIHLNASFQALDKECELQSLICGVLMNLTLRLRQQIIPYADSIMEGALKVMATYQQVKCAQLLHEEALLLVQTLADIMGSNFQRYMTNFAPHLQAGLTNFEDVKVCMFTITMIGTIATCLGAGMAQYCAAILELLYGHLQNEKVDRRVKAAIMPVFGDIALQIGGEFEQYSRPVLAVLQDAANTRIPEEQKLNEDSVEYLNTLRVGVMEAYQGIIHGLREGGKLAVFKEHVNSLLQFIFNCATEGTNSEELMHATLKVLCDVVMSFQSELVACLKSDAFAPCMQNLLLFASKGNQSMQNDGLRLQSLLQRYG
mmetsp:Transcript_24980/g.40123  ORF Transcript_24980/g.40123 Transcript_24980/m.40123 type:complete len:860 (+) Transcript_24980:81-2660(+)